MTLEKMVEGMDKNDVTKTVLIAPMNETMFEIESAFQHHLQRLFRFLILHAPQIGLKIYDGLVKDGYLKLYGNSYKIYPKPSNCFVATAIARFPDRFLGWIAVNPLIPGSMEEVEFYLNNPSFIGVKAHPFMHQYSIKAIDPIAALCESKAYL
ncbi:hypothetical protein [Bacillus sp. 7884-1]|uniref:hypothetical protein n=1 Tax=Bacillus sp. 7884-1 TaxID=2021693 RepID=UPI000BA662C2|nr:hypothetical protein [Bacillus sp. 7884-1]PAE38030.1 hypothetical protein CHI06_19180 [Bacillus sp. 7884-1]